MIVLRDPDLSRSPILDEAGGDRQRAAKEGQSMLKSLSRKAAQAAERGAILKALDETAWNRVRAAKLLNISYRALLYKLKEVGLSSDRRRSTKPAPAKVAEQTPTATKDNKDQS